MEREYERVITAAVDCGEFDIDESLEELRELCESAECEVLAQVVQRRDSPSPRAYLGEGKLAELKELIGSLEADAVVVNDELTAVQQREMTDALDVKVVDRTALILDIFARRAVSAEGKLQVELAQLKYRLPRLAGMRKQLSRLGGGIGTRGPGETKLESDRRYIRARIEYLYQKLDGLSKRRELTRRERRRREIPVVALAGYTNTGKSTLISALTDSDVPAADMLFATLDPTVRRGHITEFGDVLFVDTVGFVRRLPHDLVEAFKSTLEEVVNADVIVAVADASGDYAGQLKTTRETLASLGCEADNVIVAFNKCDKALPPEYEQGARISALNGQGLDELLAMIAEKLSERVAHIEVLIPYTKMSAADLIRKNGDVISQNYTDEGVRLEAVVDTKILSSLNGLSITTLP